MEGYHQDINTPHCRLALVYRTLPEAERKDTGVPGRRCRPLGDRFPQLQVRSGGLCEHNSSIPTPGFPHPSPQASAAGCHTRLCSQPVKSRCWSCCGLLGLLISFCPAWGRAPPPCVNKVARRPKLREEGTAPKSLWEREDGRRPGPAPLPPPLPCRHTGHFDSWKPQHSVCLPSVTRGPPDTSPLLPGLEDHIQEARAEDLVSLGRPQLPQGKRACPRAAGARL